MGRFEPGLGGSRGATRLPAGLSVSKERSTSTARRMTCLVLQNLALIQMSSLRERLQASIDTRSLRPVSADACPANARNMYKAMLR
mmetsp:Transcript_34528/g.79550  ORF Transcript_34528/g.79550 Transcript_34528/m.79550 type:complete len:86 (+) Transcript_34528:275-532(+)